RPRGAGPGRRRTLALRAHADELRRFRPASSRLSGSTASSAARSLTRPMPPATSKLRVIKLSASSPGCTLGRTTGASPLVNLGESEHHPLYDHLGLPPQMLELGTVK